MTLYSTVVYRVRQSHSRLYTVETTSLMRLVGATFTQAYENVRFFRRGDSLCKGKATAGWVYLLGQSFRTILLQKHDCVAGK